MANDPIQIDPSLLGASGYAQMADLQRRQALAQALTQQGMTPIDPMRSAGRYVVPIGRGEALGKLGQSIAGAYMGQRNVRQEGQLLQQQIDAIRGMVNGSTGNMQGQQGSDGQDQSQSEGTLGLQLTPQERQILTSTYLRNGPAEMLKARDSILSNRTRPLSQPELQKYGLPAGGNYQANGFGKIEPIAGQTDAEKNYKIAQSQGYGGDFVQYQNMPEAFKAKMQQQTFNATEGPIQRARLQFETGQNVGGAPNAAPQQGSGMPISGISQTVGKDPFANVPQISVPRNLTPKNQQDYLQKNLEQGLPISKELNDNAALANQRKALNSEVLNLVGNSDTGWLAAHQAELRNAAARFVPSQVAKASNDQQLSKVLTQLALQQGKQLFGSRYTQSEVGLMLSKAAPSIGMQAQAIKELIKMDNTRADYDIKQAQDFGTYKQRGGDPTQFKSWYSSKFPLNLGGGSDAPAEGIPDGKLGVYDASGKLVGHVSKEKAGSVPAGFEVR